MVVVVMTYVLYKKSWYCERTTLVYQTIQCECKLNEFQQHSLHVGACCFHNDEYQDQKHYMVSYLTRFYCCCTYPSLFKILQAFTICFKVSSTNTFSDSYGKCKWISAGTNYSFYICSPVWIVSMNNLYNW